jgi:hypothetical protein
VQTLEFSKSRLDDAVLQIFVDLGAGDGSQLLLDDLRLEWTKMQLHHEDLIASVRRLVFGGWLELNHTDAGPALRLSSSGRQRAQAQYSDQRSVWNDFLAAACTAVPTLRPRALHLRRGLGLMPAAG